MRRVEIHTCGGRVAWSRLNSWPRGRTLACASASETCRARPRSCREIEMWHRCICALLPPRTLPLDHYHICYNTARCLFSSSDCRCCRRFTSTAMHGMPDFLTAAISSGLKRRHLRRYRRLRSRSPAPTLNPLVQHQPRLRKMLRRPRFLLSRDDPNLLRPAQALAARALK